MKTILLYLLFAITVVHTSISVKDFEDAIALSESSKMPVLVVFSADWCKFCSILKEDIDKGVYAKETDKYIVCFIDIDQREDLKKEYQVSSIPDSRILKHKIEKSRLIGYDKIRYRKWLENNDK
jgi:thioredoxin-like negative regulator of GroEL